FFLRVRQKARRRSLRYARLHHLLRAIALLGLPLRLPHVPPEAPAPRAGAVGAEERLEVGPAVGSEGMDDECQHLARLAMPPASGKGQSWKLILIVQYTAIRLPRWRAGR